MATKGRSCQYRQEGGFRSFSNGNCGGAKQSKRPAKACEDAPKGFHRR